MSESRSPRFIQSPVSDAGPAAARAALLAPRPSIAPKYFYDPLGSKLFEAITELTEYYPTRTEAAIFAARGAEIRKAFGPGTVLVDLGAGNCAKALRLIPVLAPKRYVAVDISVEFLREALRQVQREQPRLDVVGLGQDFSAGLELPEELLEGGAPLFFYPGSSIGNFTREEAFAFLHRIRERATQSSRRPDPAKQDAFRSAPFDNESTNTDLITRLNEQPS